LPSSTLTATTLGWTAAETASQLAPEDEPDDVVASDPVTLEDWLAGTVAVDVLLPKAAMPPAVSSAASTAAAAPTPIVPRQPGLDRSARPAATAVAGSDGSPSGEVVGGVQTVGVDHGAAEAGTDDGCPAGVALGVAGWSWSGVVDSGLAGSALVQAGLLSDQAARLSVMWNVASVMVS
jgi:hypothetical protein